MSLPTCPEIPFTTLDVVVAVGSGACQESRIKTALGLPMDRVIPKVGRKTLSRYYDYLSANLQFPFVAHYPEPTNPQEERDFRCVVSSLVSPETLGDESDGLFCMVWKGSRRSEMPLIELVVPQKSHGFQLIEDYWYWLWNWR